MIASAASPSAATTTLPLVAAALAALAALATRWAAIASPATAAITVSPPGTASGPSEVRPKTRVRGFDLGRGRRVDGERTLCRELVTGIAGALRWKASGSRHGSGGGPGDNWVTPNGAGPGWDAWCGFASCDAVLDRAGQVLDGSVAIVIEVELREREALIGVAGMMMGQMLGDIGGGGPFERGTSGLDRVVQAKLAETRVAVAQGGSIRGVNIGTGPRTQNCANCAVATDATVAGRPAMALPGGPTTADQLARAFGRSANAWIPTTGPNGIKAIMTSWGSGARGVVLGSREPGKFGHFFNVVNQGGTIRFLDGQTGGAARTEGFVDYYLLRTN